MSNPIANDLKVFFDNLTSLGFKLKKTTTEKLIKKANDGDSIELISLDLITNKKTGFVSSAGIEAKFEFSIKSDGTIGFGYSRIEASTIKNSKHRDFNSLEQLIARIKRADKAHKSRMDELHEANEIARKEMEEVAKPYVEQFGEDSVELESLPNNSVCANIKYNGLEATVFRSSNVSTPEQHKTLTAKQLNATLNAHNAIKNNSPMASAIKLLSEKIDAYQAELDVVMHCDPERTAVLEKEIPELETALGLLF